MECACASKRTFTALLIACSAYLGHAQNISIYFPNTLKDTSRSRCGIAFPVYRVIPKLDSLTDSLKFVINEYLKGPTAEERALGYRTAIPTKTEILVHQDYLKEGFGWTHEDTSVSVREVSMDNDTVFIQLSPSSQAYGGGSCRIEEMLDPMRATMRGIAAKISRIYFFVEGHDNDAFQP